MFCCLPKFDSIFFLDTADGTVPRGGPTATTCPYVVFEITHVVMWRNL